MKKTKTKTNKKGISLIVLVITIIVMIILAGAVILTISNTNILDRAEQAVDATNLSEVQTIASTLWAEAYLNGARTQEDLEEKVLDGLKNVDTSDYDITVTTNGVDVKEKIKYENETPVPEEWTTNVVAVVDTVPIPKGFVASKATGENTKDGGLVIYEGTEEVNDANVEDARRNRNQYVWIPVDSSTFETKFVRNSFGMSYTTLSDTLGTTDEYWEVELDVTNMPLPSQSNMTYMSTDTLTEVQAMYASVKKYGGFYIARYEAGIETQRTSSSDAIVTGANVYSRMNKIPYNNVGWSSSSTMNVDTGGAVEIARSIYPNGGSNTTGVVSTLTYGVQWDTVLQWYIDTGALTQEEIATDSTKYGNHYNHDIAKVDELNAGAKYAVLNTSTWTLGSYQDVTESYTKGSDTTNEYHALTTGALKAANVKNIYDMAGNMTEWTMEGGTTFSRALHGGYYRYDGSATPLAYRIVNGPTNGNVYNGFRFSLYIK